MATSSFMSHNYSSSQSEVPRDHHNCTIPDRHQRISVCSQVSKDPWKIWAWDAGGGTASLFFAPQRCSGYLCVERDRPQ
ncbi:hypothetical protein TNCV_568731 [Trichonephila clavipes]|nr:hypothetical protein TNCV_568731 [Trichonephila clavipes]